MEEELKLLREFEKRKKSEEAKEEEAKDLKRAKEAEKQKRWIHLL